MRAKKTLGMLLIMGLIIALMTGCAGSNTNDQPEPNNPPKSEETVLPDAKTASAVYTGRIDNNSVELEMDGQPQAFQLTEELIETWENLGFKEGDQLKIQYQDRENDRPKLLDAKKL